MDPFIKERILDLAKDHFGRENAIDVRTAAKRVGVCKRTFRELVKELFEEGHDVICIPRFSKDCPHGFCGAAEEDFLLAEILLRKHCLSGLKRVRALEVRRKITGVQLQLIS